MYEAIPYEVLSAGIEWEWVTFPEYMDAAARHPRAINIGLMAPLTPFRHFVMGEESMERAASPEEDRKHQGAHQGSRGQGRIRMVGEPHADSRRLQGTSTREPAGGSSGR